VVQGGRFQMGSPRSDTGRLENEIPQRPVTVPALGVALNHVTLAEFRAFVEATDYRTDAERNKGGRPGCFAVVNGSDFGWEAQSSWREPGFPQGDDHPVVCVSWNDSEAYANWISERTGHDYRLMSEAEFEYSLRARTSTPWPWGRFETAACTHANIADQSTRSQFPNWPITDCDGSHVYTAPARSYAPNSFGLYDMSGNVWHWVSDCWNENYEGAPIDGSAWMSGDCTRAALRGGSWSYDALYARSAHRGNASRDYRSANTGFRIAREVEL